jgi:hypothetical protein
VTTAHTHFAQRSSSDTNNTVLLVVTTRRRQALATTQCQHNPVVVLRKAPDSTIQVTNYKRSLLINTTCSGAPTLS